MAEKTTEDILKESMEYVEQATTFTPYSIDPNDPNAMPVKYSTDKTLRKIRSSLRKLGDELNMKLAVAISDYLENEEAVAKRHQNHINKNMNAISDSLNTLIKLIGN